MPSNWIVQANPDRYNLDGRLQLAPEAVSWSIRQHADRVAEGDVVWIWRAAGTGKRTSGIVARGRFGGPAHDDVSPDPFVIGGLIEGDAPRRAVTLDAVLPPGDALAREVIAGDPALASLSILTVPQSTVFPVRIEEANALEALFERAAAAHPVLPAEELPSGMNVEALRERRDACYRHPAFWKWLDDALRMRREALPEMADLVRRFVAGALDVEGFRETFDRRSRTGTWAAFGFGGMSGAMSLNKLVKHLPDTGALERVLRSAAAAPANVDEAAARLAALEGLLEQAIAAKQATRFNLQPARIPTLLSDLWHVQAPNDWPVRYDSVSRALAQAGAQLGGHLGERYGAFRSAERATRAVLRLPPEVLDLVCAPDGPLDLPPRPPAPRRTWAVGVGHADRDEYWSWFRDDRVVAIGGGIGDLAAYADKDAMFKALQKQHGYENPTRDALGSWQFYSDMQPGDRVITRQGRSIVLGIGEIDGPYRHQPESPYEYVRDVRWSWTGRITLPEAPLAIQTLVDVTARADLLAAIEAATTASPKPPPVGMVPVTPTPVYTLDDATRGLFCDRSEMEANLARLRRRRSLVLQGPPGTGKSFVAARLARLLTGDPADARVRRVQFHPSYTYEHFVQGFRANEAGGFALVDGPFKQIADAARADLDHDYVLLVDEINRGNLGRILGELMLLLEGDKRSPEWKVDLAYSGASFWVPPNVYVIGTMNTADRSIAVVDYALRRRFAFATVAPAWTRTQLRDHLVARAGDAEFVERLMTAMREINRVIGEDADLGVGYRIGHSWFCDGPASGASARAWLADIVDTEIEPLLSEYWFDREETRDAAVALLRWDE